MPDQRALLMFMVPVCYHLDRFDDMVVLMKEVVRLNPRLDSNERGFLDEAYVNAAAAHHQAILGLDAHLCETEEGRGNPALAARLRMVRATCLLELERITNDLFELVDTRLAPVAEDPLERMSYWHLKARLQKFLCDVKPASDRQEAARNAIECFESAIDFALNGPIPFQSRTLQIVRQYCTLLADVLGRKEEAIALGRLAVRGFDVNGAVEEWSNWYTEPHLQAQWLLDELAEWTGEAAPNHKLR
jgi:hypothetical protein